MSLLRIDTIPKPVGLGPRDRAETPNNYPTDTHHVGVLLGICWVPVGQVCSAA
jgi:hypothetical protein